VAFLVIPVLLVLSLVILVPRLRIAALPFERPLLPSPPETDQDIYRMLVPEEPPRADAAANSVLSGTLKVAQYRAQSGESISQIAQRFKLNIDTLISWNDIRDAQSIHPGTMLGIPNSDGLKYTVHRGDTLEQIARVNGLSLNTVLDWNRLPSSVISVGQELFLPGVHMRTNDLNRVLGNLFIYPVRGKISSFFGMRPDPFTGVKRFHNGLDIVNSPGTPIMAAMAGTVEDVGFNNNYGYYVILRHSGYQTLYGHLSRYVVERRDKVQQGEKIGELGTTGYSTGPHLHFSIFRNGEAVDPLAFLK
jgi:murein DD-endopeptidase MepM/ murein hydrolase activator NlpD